MIALLLIVLALVYLRGWWRMPSRSLPSLACFVSALVMLGVAILSPLDTFAGLWLQVHMIQHLLLMMVVPALFWLADPVAPLVRGLPRAVSRDILGPLMAWPELRRVTEAIEHPLSAWLLYHFTLAFWHVPALFELTLRSPFWHHVEHACFLGAGLLFWRPILRGPAQWGLLPYLFLADIVNTLLSAILTFSPVVLYPHYAGVAALDDQATAGVLMWVPGSIAYLVPLAWLGCRLLFGDRRPVPRQPVRLALTMVTDRRSFDLLRLPLLGTFLRWRHARLAMQIPLVLLAVLVVADGLFGPQIAPLNLAGVLPWIHWRGLLVIGLLIAGNVFCMACPFQMPRNLMRRWLSPRFRWPSVLANKWLAIVALIAFFGAYEVFALWDRPGVTAWIVVGYFVAALLVDAFFRGASFCKHLCPIGQFNFVGSLLSPLEVTVRDRAVCATCTTHDCRPACELGLNPPQKAGNMDCTLCLECVHACPHDNLAIAARNPLTDLTSARPRLDLAILFLTLTFAAFVNAAGMVAPVVAAQNALAAHLGSSIGWVVAGCYLIALPGSVALALALPEVRRLAITLVPIGMGMWLAHYTFHLLATPDPFGPILARWSSDPETLCCCCAIAPGWLLRVEILFLDFGLLGSLYALHQAKPMRGNAWGGLIIALFVLGLWLLFQPMQMRGAMPR